MVMFYQDWQIMIKFILGLSIGILFTSHVYNSYLDPMDIYKQGAWLARQAYKYGCVIEHGKNCEGKALEYWEKIR